MKTLFSKEMLSSVYFFCKEIFTDMFLIYFTVYLIIIIVIISKIITITFKMQLFSILPLRKKLLVPLILSKYSG